MGLSSPPKIPGVNLKVRRFHAAFSDEAWTSEHRSRREKNATCYDVERAVALPLNSALTLTACQCRVGSDDAISDPPLTKIEGLKGLDSQEEPEILSR